MVEKILNKATIADVASLAGVSTATVGRVLGGYGYASEEVRLRVRQAAERLAYRPNLLARSLITGKTKTIGFIAGDIQSPFYAGILRSISNEARAQGFGVIVVNSDETIPLEVEATSLLLEKQVDGLILSPCDTTRSEHLRKAVKEGLPVVQIDRIVEGLNAASVTVNNREAARHAVGSLIALGHRRIAMLAELEHRDVSKTSDFINFIQRVEPEAVDGRSLMPSWSRFFGYLDAHRAAGIDIDPKLVARVGSYSLTQARKQAHDLLCDSDRPTALFTADGLMSAGAIHAISELDIAVPDQLSLIGFDDVDWMGFMRPGITAVSQPLADIGQTAARLMLDSLSSGDKPKDQIVLHASLIWRGSVSAAALA